MSFLINAAQEGAAQALAKRYHETCEAYDLTVCTGPVVDGSVMPVSSAERMLVNQNAYRVLRQLQEEAERLGISNQQLHKAIGDMS